MGVETNELIMFSALGWMMTEDNGTKFPTLDVLLGPVKLCDTTKRRYCSPQCKRIFFSLKCVFRVYIDRFNGPRFITESGKVV